MTELGPGTFAVVEELPVAVDVDFHPSAEFGIVGFLVDEPCVGIFGAGDVLGVDDVAVRVEYAVIRHSRGLPAAVMPNRASPR